MVKNYLQNIPSDVYDSYTSQITKAFFPGFRFYISDYGYWYTNMIRIRPPLKVSEKYRGLGPDITDKRALNRFAMQYAAYYWKRTDNVTGVVPPATGHRKKDWWYDHNPYAPEKIFNYYFAETKYFISSLAIPPWNQKPYFYFIDSATSQIKQYDTNTFMKTWEIGSVGSENGQFQEPETLTVDNLYLYVCDSLNARIVVLEKNSGTFLRNITTFGTPPTNFVSPRAICCDNNYLYIADDGITGIIKIEKTDSTNYENIRVKKIGTESTPHITSIQCNAEYLHYLDGANKRIWSTNIANNEIYSYYGLLIDPVRIVLDNEFLLCADKGTKKILALGRTWLNKYFEIGPGCLYDINFQDVSDICVSGDLLFVLDNILNVIWKIDFTDRTEIEKIPVPDDFTTIQFIGNEPQFLYGVYKI